MEHSASSPKRNYGIDLLRIISMFYVLVLHTVGQGGILAGAEKGSVQYMLAWFFRVWCFCAVDIFALISGYVGYSPKPKKLNCANYVMLWLQVVFYGAAITVFFRLLNPEWATKDDLLRSLFPVTNNLYWYLTAYTGLYVLMPLINAGIRGCNESQLRKLFAAVIIVFAVFDTFTRYFYQNKGYSVLWLTIMYILGAVIRKCDIGKNISLLKSLAGIVICSVACWLWALYGKELKLFNIVFKPDDSVTYTSLPVMLSAVLYIIGFSKLKTGKAAQKVISIAAPAAFSAYIINNQQLVWIHIIKDRYRYIAMDAPLKIAAYVLGFSFIFLAVSIAIDRVRIFIFNALHIRNAAQKLCSFISDITGKITQKL